MTTMEKLKLHKEEVLKYYPEDQLLGVFLYGSQNYGIDTETSDVDTKAILIPTFKELVFGEPISRELHFKNGEHCEVKDIREIKKMFEKQNINFLEILFTDYCWINPKYNALWRKYFVDKAELICHTSERQTITSICAQAIRTLTRDKHDGKKYANGLRLYYTLKRYLNKVPYKRAINIESYSAELAKLLIQYKTGKKDFTEENVDDLIGKLKWIESLAEQYPSEPKKESIKALEEGVFALISFKEEEDEEYAK